jgi:hypothetical protein
MALQNPLLNMQLSPLLAQLAAQQQQVNARNQQGAAEAIRASLAGAADNRVQAAIAAARVKASQDQARQEMAMKSFQSALGMADSERDRAARIEEGQAERAARATEGANFRNWEGGQRAADRDVRVEDRKSEATLRREALNADIAKQKSYFEHLDLADDRDTANRRWEFGISQGTQLLRDSLGRKFSGEQSDLDRKASKELYGLEHGEKYLTDEEAFTTQGDMKELGMIQDALFASKLDPTKQLTPKQEKALLEKQAALTQTLRGKLPPEKAAKVLSSFNLDDPAAAAAPGEMVGPPDQPESYFGPWLAGGAPRAIDNSPGAASERAVRKLIEEEKRRKLLQKGEPFRRALEAGAVVF